MLGPQPGAIDHPKYFYTTVAWRRTRLDYLSRHPACVLCGKAATDVDHYPRTRRALLAAGVVDPDVDDHLRALCHRCHSQETARRQPGGWNAR